jgi:hypothetical protein
MSTLPFRREAVLVDDLAIRLRYPRTLPTLTTWQRLARILSNGGSAAFGTAVTLIVLALFLLTADKAFSSGYLAPLLGVVWDLDVNAGGQWLEQGLLAVVHSIPGAGPELLVLLTSTLIALAIGWFCVTLRKRGWSMLTSLIAGLLIAVHPVTLHLASCGQPAVLSALAVGLLIICVDRAAALSDAQSLMTLGLAFALLFVTDSNALYLILPVLAMMPWMLREMRDGVSSAALFLILMVPSVVLIAALLAGSMVVGVAPETILRHWLAVLHGGLSEDLLGTSWLVENGGWFVSPLADLLWLALVCFPAVLVVLLRLLISPMLSPSRRRIRFGSALLAVFLPPLASAFAVFFWHQQSRETAMAMTLAAGCAWVMTVSMRRMERFLWIAAVLCGVIFSWSTGFMQAGPDAYAWRTSLTSR